MTSFVTFTLHKILYGWSNERVFNTHGRYEKCIRIFGRKTWRDHSEDV